MDDALAELASSVNMIRSSTGSRRAASRCWRLSFVVSISDRRAALQRRPAQAAEEAHTGERSSPPTARARAVTPPSAAPAAAPAAASAATRSARRRGTAAPASTQSRLRRARAGIRNCVHDDTQDGTGRTVLLEPGAVFGDAQHVEDDEHEHRLDRSFEHLLPLRRVVQRVAGAPRLREAGLRAVTQLPVDDHPVCLHQARCGVSAHAQQASAMHAGAGRARR